MQSWPVQDDCASRDEPHSCVASTAYQQAQYSASSLDINGQLCQPAASAEDFTALGQNAPGAFKQNSLRQQLSTDTLQRPIVAPESQPRQLRQEITHQILSSKPLYSTLGESERRVVQYSHACCDPSRGVFDRNARLASRSQSYRRTTCSGGRDSSRASRKPAERCDSASRRDGGIPALPRSFLGEHPGRAHDVQSQVGSQASERQNTFPIALDGVADGTVVPSREKEGRKGPVSAYPIPVADRIRAIEEKDAQNSALPRRPTMLQRTYATKNVVPSKDASNQKSNVPMVFPLHVRKFTRRTSSAAPIRPETPLYHAQPNHDSTIHSPQALRALPMPEPPPSRATQQPSDSPIASYKTPPEMLDTTRGDHDSSIARNMGYGRRQSKNFAVRPTSRPSERGRQRISPASFLMGTKDNCVRHGRRPARDLQNKKVTRDMVEKSDRTGAYRPTGLPARRQMEATSPWAYNQNLTWKKGSSDVCPDCLAELDLKRRELGHTTEKEGSTSTVRRPVDRSREDVSWLGEIAENDLHGSGVPPVWTPRITPRDAQGHEIHKQVLKESASKGLVIEHNLGDRLDAAVFECGGDLESVVLNTKFGKPPPDTLERLAKNLHEAAKALTKGNAKYKSQAHPSPLNCALILDVHPGTNQESVPELMEMIDDAVNGFHHDNDRPLEHQWPTVVQDYALGTTHGIGNQSLVQSEDIDAVFGGISPGARLVHRQTFHDYEQLQKQYSQAPVPPHPDVHAASRSWWWPISRQRSREPSPHPTSGAVPIITTTQPSQRPSLAQAPGTQSLIAANSPAQSPVSPSPKSPAANTSASLLPTPLASKPFTAVVPPTTSTPRKDASGSAIHPSISEVLDPANQVSTASQPEVVDKSRSPASKTTPPIAREANPYHHAPSTPRDLHTAN